VDKRLVVGDLEAVLVREVFALYLEHRSALRVARLLNERGRATKRHRAANGNLRESRPWDKADVLRILKNPLYGGYMASGGELYKAEHTPLIERDTFTRVQGLLDAATKRTTAGRRNPHYILRGVLRCACCGSAFTPASTRKGRTQHRYYRSVKREKEGKDACTSSPLPAGAIEAYVLERLKEATADGSLAADVTASVRNRAAARRKDLRTERQKLPPEIATLSAEGKRLVEAIAEVNGAGRRLLDERLQEVGDQLGRCEARLAAAEREIANLDAIEVEASWVAQCLTDFDSVWDVLTPENRGRLLRAVVQRVEVNEAANQVSVFITHLGGELPGTSTALEPIAQKEAAP
jgi:site-specific DNA recombinase